MSLQVLFATQYGPRAASSRTRVFNYLPYLRSRGVACEVVTVLPDEVVAGSQLIASEQPLRKALYYLRVAWRTVTCGFRIAYRASSFDVLFVQNWPQSDALKFQYHIYIFLHFQEILRKA